MITFVLQSTLHHGGKYMNPDKISAEDISFLKDIIARTESRLLEYKKILVIWAVILIINNVVSQILIYAEITFPIPFIWTVTVAAGIIISHFAAKAVRRKTKINAFLARFIALLWFGGIAAIFILSGITFLIPELDPQYIPALSFPVIGLCIFGTASLFKARIGYFVSVLLFIAAVPAALFPQHGMLIQAVITGGGTLIIGLTKNEQTESD